MRTKEELQTQIDFLTTLMNNFSSKWNANMISNIRADIQDELDSRNGEVISSLQTTKLSDSPVEDVQASGLPNQPKPMVEGLPTSDKRK